MKTLTVAFFRQSLRSDHAAVGCQKYEKIAMSSKLDAVIIAFSAILLSVGAFQQQRPISLRSVSSVEVSTHRSLFQRTTLSLGASVPNLAETTTVQDADLDWSFLDAVYLITCPNADPNRMRLNRAIGILDDVGLADRVEIKEFDTDDENRIRGCYTSHICVLNSVLESTKGGGKGNNKNLLQGLFRNFGGNVDFLKDGGEKTTDGGRNVNVLVLEDNLALNGAQLKQELLNSVAKYMTTDPDWDVIHLSYIPYVPDLKVSRTNFQDIVKLSSGVGSALGTTAYIINSEAIKKLLKDDRDNNGFYLPIPDVMAKLFPETRYASNPTIFVRAPNTKSLVNPQLDDLRELLFQPVVASFSQQLLLTTGLTTNLLLPITILVLLGASGASLFSTFVSFHSLITNGDFDGPIIIPLLSGAFSLFSLAVLAKGIMLAPKQQGPA